MPGNACDAGEAISERAYTVSTISTLSTQRCAQFVSPTQVLECRRLPTLLSLFFFSVSLCAVAHVDDVNYDHAGARCGIKRYVFMCAVLLRPACAAYFAGEAISKRAYTVSTISTLSTQRCAQFVSPTQVLECRRLPTLLSLFFFSVSLCAVAHVDDVNYDHAGARCGIKRYVFMCAVLLRPACAAYFAGSCGGDNSGRRRRYRARRGRGRYGGEVRVERAEV